MLKKVAIFTAFAIVATLVGAIIYSAMQPRSFSWFPSYSNYGKQPYDTYVFYQQLPNFFSGKHVRKLKETDLEGYYRDEMYDADTLINDEYILVVDSTAYYSDLGSNYRKFNFISVEQMFYAENIVAKALLQHLYQGNRALIASEEVSELLLKMIDVKMELVDFEEEDSIVNVQRFTIGYDNQEPFAFKPAGFFSRITAYPEKAKVIAKNALDDVVGITIPVGKGSITIFSMPIIFTNYYLLKQNNSIVERLLLEMPEEDTYWAKTLRGSRPYEESRSLMDFIHSQKSLTWAFYTLIIGVLLFLILQLRRVERPVPLIVKPENISLSFIESVSALFYLHKDNKELIRKKMNYFLDRVRNQYHLDTQVIDDQFIARLAKKLQVKPALLTLIFNLYNEYTQKPVVANEDFLRFNKLMQTFKIKD